MQIDAEAAVLGAADRQAEAGGAGDAGPDVVGGDGDVMTLLLTAMVAPPVGADSVAVKLSAGSSVVSLVIGTLKDLEALSPSAQLKVPLAAVKSAPDVAVPPAVA